ncbi:MAG: SprT family zinc-dependent metalloprotease [Bacteroidia bacterium]|nr:SprT family zinc-dependent metalloprotease [Bacteroidia bacterium]
MAASYQLDIPPIGKVDIYESRQCRRVTLRVGAGGIVRVSVPPLTTPKLIYEFVKANIEFINKAKIQVEKKAPKHIFTASEHFSTKSHTLRLSPTATDNRFHGKVSAGVIEVVYPSDVKEDDEQLQEFIHKAIAAALKIESKKYIIPRLATLAKEHNFSYNKVDLRDMTSRWGSCDTRGRICINIHCMRLPNHLIDYVLLHELCHTIYHDHQAGFWAKMEEVCNGQAKILDKELNKYHTRY